MNSSAYASLLQALRDETEGADGATPPPLDTSTPVLEPGGAVAPISASMPAPEPTPLPVAPLTPPAPSAAPVAPVLPPIATPKVDARPSVRTLADKYGVHMEDAAPLPPSTNTSSSLLADLGRAGTTISSAIGGIKNDPSFYNNIEARGAQHAAENDKNLGDMVNFKRHILLKSIDDKAAKAKLSDPDLSNPNSAAYKQMKAQYTATDAGKEFWNRMVKENGNVEPDLNTVAIKPDKLLPRDTSLTNAGTTDKRSKDQFVASQLHQEKMAQIAMENSMTKDQFGEELKLARDQRDSFVPDRGFVDDKQPPTAAQAAEIRKSDAFVHYVLPSITRLKEMVVAESEGRVIPGMNGKITSLSQAIKNAGLQANGFGVPNGKDWEKLTNEFGDPTRVRDLFTGAAGDQISEAAIHLADRNENIARTYGFKPYEADSGHKVDTTAIPSFKARIQGYGNPPAAPTAGAPASAPPGPASAKPVQNTKTTPSGKPYAIQAKDKTGNIVFFDANGDEVE